MSAIFCKIICVNRKQKIQCGNSWEGARSRSGEELWAEQLNDFLQAMLADGAQAEGDYGII